MTVTTTQTSVTWAGNGSTTEFSYPFLIPAAGQYALYYTNAAGATVLVGQSLYSVSGIGNQGGTLVYPLTGSPVAAGTTLTFQRVVPYQQVFHPPAQGPIYNPLLEGASIICKCRSSRLNSSSANDDQRRDGGQPHLRRRRFPWRSPARSCRV